MSVNEATLDGCAVEEGGEIVRGEVTVRGRTVGGFAGGTGLTVNAGINVSDWQQPKRICEPALPGTSTTILAKVSWLAPLGEFEGKLKMVKTWEVDGSSPSKENSAA